MQFPCKCSDSVATCGKHIVHTWCTHAWFYMTALFQASLTILDYQVLHCPATQDFLLDGLLLFSDWFGYLNNLGSSTLKLWVLPGNFRKKANSWPKSSSTNEIGNSGGSSWFINGKIIRDLTPIFQTNGICSMLFQMSDVNCFRLQLVVGLLLVPPYDFPPACWGLHEPPLIGQHHRSHIQHTVIYNPVHCTTQLSDTTCTSGAYMLENCACPTTSMNQIR